MSNTTLLFDDNDIGALTGIIVPDWGPLFAPMARRGQFVTVPNRNGWLGDQLPLDGYNFDLTVVLAGDSEADWFDNLTALAEALEGLGGLGTLERRWDNSDASSGPGYVSHYADGAFAGLNLSTLNHMTGSLDLTFANLSGRWFSDIGLTTPVPI